MPRSRTTIEAEIAALQAELAAHQPTSLRLKTMYNDNFAADFSSYDRPGGVAYVSVHNGPAKGLTRPAAQQLAAWLNYHFPKENA